MKEIIKERTSVEKYTVYEAVDGTQFDYREDCEKYENSAKGVLRGKLSRLIVNDQYGEYSLFKCGCYDGTIIAVKLPTEADVDIVLQAYYLDNPYILTENNNACRTYLIDTLLQAYKEKDIVLFGFNCNDGLYLIDSRSNIIKRLVELTKKKEKSENEQLSDDVKE